MKKSHSIRLLTVLTASVLLFGALSLPSSVFAKESLSPAIDTISQNTVFVKNGIRNSSVKFTCTEFEDALGCERISSITVLVLPDESDGKLMLGKVPVLANQVIPRSKLSKLSFVPEKSSVNEASFVFGCISSGYPRVTSCFVRFTDTLNFAPSAAEYEISAFSGVMRKDILRAVDPDGDRMTFTVASLPKNGTLSLRDPSSGEYVYTPNANASGKDSFTFVAKDPYGNRSEETTVTVNIKKAPSVNYVDVSSEDLYGRLLLAEKGIFAGRNVGKYSYFEGDLPVSYDEFIIMAMSAAGESLPENDGDVISVFNRLYDVEVSSDESISCSVAIEIASDIGKSDLDRSKLPSGDLTRDAAAEIILEMIG